LDRRTTALNAVCPYFTMFPLDFPLQILRDHAGPGDWVLDPFCGRGTTNFAARLLGLPTTGIDSSPVEMAIARAKLARTTPEAIMRTAHQILAQVPAPCDIPQGEFWSLAYERTTLHTLCRLREGLLQDCQSDARVALRAVLLGALHGPRPKHGAAYLSNQSPRTYAPKPAYAVRFWQSRGLVPAPVGVPALIEARARRFYGTPAPSVQGGVVLGDSRRTASYRDLPGRGAVRWVITSPPYYGLRTYLPDQWLRRWFLGGPPHVDYTNQDQLEHTGPAHLEDQLRAVWQHAATCCAPQATMVVRFGGINDRRVDPLVLIQESLRGSGWAVREIRPAGAASEGRRQALHFGRPARAPLAEHDIWATLA
jgi:hypothetical protein